MNSPRTSSLSDSAGWLTAALVALPFLQAAPVDFDRNGALILMLPALWTGRHVLARAVSRVQHGPVWLRLCAGVAGLATVLSVVFADQPAPAAVTAASWILLTATGLLAGQLVSETPRAAWRLLAGLVLGTAAGSVAVWILWWLGGREAVPLYAHHRHLGLHTMAGAIAAVALLLRPGLTRRQILGWGLAGALTWGGMLWSGGRAPLLAVAAGLGVWVIIGRPPERKRLLKISTLLFLAGLVISAAGWTANPELGWWHAFSRTAAAAAEGSASKLTSTRSEFWRSTVERAETAPWLGHGPDAYRFLTPKLDGQQPHNVVLQLWLDVGLIGAIPLLAILAWLLGRGGKTAGIPEDPATRAWLALLVASVVAGLLDGVFYHLLAFLPAMLAAGLILSSLLAPTSAQAKRFVPAATLGTAILLLTLHLGIFYVLAVAPPPAPASLTARVVRAFPSTTFGLWRWLDAWEPEHPAEALAWTRWAETHSSNPIFFHLHAAQLLAARGDRAGVEAELQAARAKAHWSARPSIDAMLDQLHSVSR